MGTVTLEVLLNPWLAVDESDPDEWIAEDVCQVTGEVIQDGQVLHRVEVITTDDYAETVRATADDVMNTIKEWALKNTNYSPPEKRSYLKRIWKWLNPART